MRICPSCGACSDDAYDLCAFDGSLLQTAFEGPRVVEGRYLLEQRVAAGAMGTVFRAVHVQVGSQVAVKIMQPEDGELQVALARFHREAQVLGQIKHPNAVLVMDFGIENRSTHSVPYLVTEYLRGEPLSAYIHERGPLPLARATNIVQQICEAVSEAHSVGVIHRDIKPSNVFVEQLRDGTEIVKVLDFGIAKFVERTPDHFAPLPAQATQNPAHLHGAPPPVGDTTVKNRAAARSNDAPGDPRSPHDRTLTEAGFMIGTIRYMAPEQMTGERVSQATDCYAIASVLFELLTGHPPFPGSDDEIIDAKISDERPKLADYGLSFGDAFDAFLSSCFSLEPPERPQDVTQIVAALCLAADGARVVPDAEVSNALGDEGERLSGRLDDLVATLTQASHAGSPDALYVHIRDAVLALTGPAEQCLTLSERARSLGLDAPAWNVPLVRDTTRQAAAAIRRLERSLPYEFAAYVTAVWQSAAKRTERVLASMENLSPAGAAARVFVRNPFAIDDAADTLTPLIEQLDSDDVLDSAEALERIIDSHLDTVATLVARSASTAATGSARLVAGLARHADVLLLMELYPQAQRFRLLPLLAGLTHLPEAAPFVALEQIFSGVRHGEKTALAAVRTALGPEAAPWAVDALQRALLVHPLDEVRQEAAADIGLNAFWNVIVYPGTPTRTLRTVLDAVLRRGPPPEYLKIFFLCVRRTLRAPSNVDELEEAMRFVETLFGLPCFAEDMVFESLLEVDAALRVQHERLGAAREVFDRYDRHGQAFRSHGASESNAIERVRDVPLPIQRKLAREGLLLSFFVTHRHERIARETIPHLLRLDDVMAYIKLPTLHRVVLTELGKKKRFFRRDAARVALLSHPKTPVHIARVYLPVLPHEQIRLLAKNKSVGADVRALAAKTYARIAEKRGV